MAKSRPFFAIAAQAMRRILVDYARQRQREKRGGRAENLPLEQAISIVSQEKSVDLVALDNALTRLENLTSDKPAWLSFAILAA